MPDTNSSIRTPHAEDAPATDDRGSNDAVALVAALLRGDPGAPGQLFDQYGEGIHRVLIRIIGAHDSEGRDLLHDVFLRALDHVAKLKNPAALKGWLKGIAVFTAQEWLRARRRMGQPQGPDNTMERAGVSASPEAREAVRVFYEVMDSFPEDERVAFVLRFVEGMELTEVADACRVSLSTARRRIARARQRFMDILPSVPALQDRVLGVAPAFDKVNR